MKGAVIRLDIGWWTKERLMYHTSKLFNLTTKPGSNIYILNSRLCDLAMNKFSSIKGSINIEILNKFLKEEMLKLISIEKEQSIKSSNKSSKIYRF